MSSPKEPKYWMCDDAPPPRLARTRRRSTPSRSGSGGSADYERLFERRRPDQVRGESTPFYLWTAARTAGSPRRCPREADRGRARPDRPRLQQLDAPVVRRAGAGSRTSRRAFALEHERIDAGWAPFWRYRDLGRYGEQLAHLLSVRRPGAVLVLRYRTIVDDPQGAVDRACHFLGIAPGLIETEPMWPSGRR